MGGEFTHIQLYHALKRGETLPQDLVTRSLDSPPATQLGDDLKQATATNPNSGRASIRMFTYTFFPGICHTCTKINPYSDSHFWYPPFFAGHMRPFEDLGSAKHWKKQLQLCLRRYHHFFLHRFGHGLKRQWGCDLKKLGERAADHFAKHVPLRNSTSASGGLFTSWTSSSWLLRHLNNMSLEETTFLRSKKRKLTIVSWWWEISGIFHWKE